MVHSPHSYQNAHFQSLASEQEHLLLVRNKIRGDIGSIALLCEHAVYYHGKISGKPR